MLFVRRKSLLFGWILVLLALTTLFLLSVDRAKGSSDPACTITGTEGADVIVGTEGDDIICGLGGDDNIDALGGDDTIYAGPGADLVHGREGADVIYGGPGNDELRGNEDNDEIYGEDGDDILGGGQDQDLLVGGLGADYIEGKRGDDVIYGGPGDDELRGNEDNDEIYGEDGDDILGGGKGNDFLLGGPGNDNIEGKRGDDLLRGDSGDDTLFGDQGADSLDGGSGTDSANGGPDTDTCEAEVTAACEGELSAEPEVTWTDAQVSVTVAQGSSAYFTPEFTANTLIAGAAMSAEGGVSDLVFVDNPDVEVSIRPGAGYWTAVVDVPVDTPTGTYTGSLRLLDRGTPTETALPIEVIVTAQTTSLVGFAAPSGERILESAEDYIYIDNELIVIIAANVPDVEAAIQDVATTNDGIVVGGELALRMYQLRFTGNDLASLISLGGVIEARPDVGFASVHYISQALAAFPDDEEWDTWDASDPGGNNWNLEYIDAPAGWDITTGDADVPVAIIDQGIRDDHEDLASNFDIYDGFYSDAEGARGHGTHVAGIACAAGNNGIGISGVAWQCSLRGYEFLFAANQLPDPEPAWYQSPFASARRMLTAARDGARVVNMSWGAPGFCTSELTPTAATFNTWLGSSIETAAAEGFDVLWVAAAGNSRCDAQFTSPAGLSLVYDNVITVAAIEKDGTLLNEGLGRGSNFGAAVNVAAPGDRILSTVPHFRWAWVHYDYSWFSGTSQAAPHVTGLAALMLSVNPTLSGQELRTCIVDSADSDGRAVPGHGFNVINVPAALDCAGTSSNLVVNGSFETGDLSGWTTFQLPGEEAVFSASTDMVSSGTYSASMQTCSDPGPAGFEQMVAVTQGERYYASVWFSSDGRADMGFEVLASDGTVLASGFSTPFGTGQYGARSDDFIAPGSDVRFRLVYLTRYVECLNVYFDDAVLSVDPPPLNLGFETGDLTGWEHVESEINTLDVWLVTSPVWEGNYSARVSTQSDLPNGIQREDVELDTCTSVRTQLVFGPPATARLEIESATGAVYAGDVLLNTVGAWRFVEVFHPFLGSGSTVRLLIVNGNGSQAVFDDVVQGTCP